MYFAQFSIFLPIYPILVKQPSAIMNKSQPNLYISEQFEVRSQEEGIKLQIQKKYPLPNLEKSFLSIKYQVFKKGIEGIP